MSRALDRIRHEAMEQYGDAPATPAEALDHVLAVFADQPDHWMVLEATNGIYGDGVRTGLTMGDLRALRAARPIRRTIRPLRSPPCPTRRRSPGSSAVTS